MQNIKAMSLTVRNIWALLKFLKSRSDVMFDKPDFKLEKQMKFMIRCCVSISEL